MPDTTKTIIKSISKEYFVSANTKVGRWSSKTVNIQILSRTPDCCGEVITNIACGKEFFYCRGCKKEVGLVSTTDSGYDSDYTPEVWVPAYNSLMNFITNGGCVINLSLSNRCINCRNNPIKAPPGYICPQGTLNFSTHKP